MRIVHFADVHIGVENYAKVDPETGLSTRLTDFLATFDEVVSYALENSADLVLFCGDAYKSRDPSQTHQREFARRVARLSAEGIPTFLVVGNHDSPNVIGRATALEIFNTLEVPNVYTGDRVETYLVQTRSGPLQIVAVPWIRRSEFLRRDDQRGLTADEINEEIQEGLSRIIRNLAEELDENVPAVLAGHVTVGGSETSSEKSMMLGRDHVLLRSNVALPQLDYVALGHIHRHQILGKDPHVVYSGSLQRIDFGEEGDEKGFCVVDLDPTRPAGSRLVEFNFQTVDARRFLTIEVNVHSGDADPTATVLRAISSHELEGAIVRVMISVPGELEAHLHDREIADALTDAHFVASVSRDVQDQPRSRLGDAYSEGLDPADALKVYLESRQVPADRIEVLMRRAEALMQEGLPE
jgi:exonuclease SbcD